MAAETLPGGFQKHSSVIGFGRNDISSNGVAEALSGAKYGGETRAPHVSNAESLMASRTGATLPPSQRSGLEDSVTVWNVAAIRADDAERAARAMSRAPNRIFDTVSAPVIMAAVPDPFVREAREIKELRAKLPTRPIDKPLNYTATAQRLNESRRIRTIFHEVETVRALPLP